MAEDKLESFGAQAPLGPSPGAFPLGLPLGRAAQPAELAPLYVFLASPESSCMTSEVLGVTGGPRTKKLTHFVPQAQAVRHPDGKITLVPLTATDVEGTDYTMDKERTLTPDSYRPKPEFNFIKPGHSLPFGHCKPGQWTSFARH
jgi:hypothetical protein